MNLNEYETPLTDAAEKAKWWRSDGTPMETTTGSVPADFARDLERKLALCRYVLKRISSDGLTPPEIADQFKYGCFIGGGMMQTIHEALAATEPKQ